MALSPVRITAAGSGISGRGLALSNFAAGCGGLGRPGPARGTRGWGPARKFKLQFEVWLVFVGTGWSYCSTSELDLGVWVFLMCHSAAHNIAGC